MSLTELIEVWKKRQATYEKVAEKYRDTDPHNYKKYTYKAQATRDCWEELSTLINKTKTKC